MKGWHVKNDKSCKFWHNHKEVMWGNLLLSFSKIKKKNKRSLFSFTGHPTMVSEHKAIVQQAKKKPC